MVKGMASACITGFTVALSSASTSAQTIGPTQVPPTGTIPGTSQMATAHAMAVTNHFPRKPIRFSFRSCE